MSFAILRVLWLAPTVINCAPDTKVGPTFLAALDPPVRWAPAVTALAPAVNSNFVHCGGQLNGELSGYRRHCPLPKLAPQSDFLRRVPGSRGQNLLSRTQ